MNFLRAIGPALMVGVLIGMACPAVAEWRWPTWPGSKNKSVSTAHSKSKKPLKPTKAAGKTTGKSLFTNPKSLFTPKPKSENVAWWTRARNGSNRPKRDLKETEKKSWFGSLFTPSEPKPPQSIEQWMDLEQIKP
jgi:hypothetical protein